MIKNKESLKGKIRNLSKEKGIDSHYLLQSYMFEALLKRVSKSNYKDKFVIKGGLLLSSIFGIDLRSTMDLDTTIIGIALNKENITNIIKEIINIDIDDNIIFTLISVKDIREDDMYAGYAIRLTANYDDLKVDLTIDITTGDVITYNAIEYHYKTLFDKDIDILAYNNETIIAEKYESIISRNIDNTRMKDYYDLYMFVKYRWDEVDGAKLAAAIARTSKHRGSERYLKQDDAYIKLIKEDDNLKGLWRTYQEKNVYAQGIEYDAVTQALEEVKEKKRKNKNNKKNG